MIAKPPIRTPRSHLAPSLGKPRWAALGALALSLYSARGAAQAEAQKPAPNVLLLVDNSGSMEFKTDGTLPNCTFGSTALSQKSRWIDLVEVLTGSFEGYSCWKEPRNTTQFRDEFALGGVQPYDYGYVNPYHRPLSNECVVGPGVLPPSNSPYTWPTNYVNTFPVVESGGSLVVNRPSSASLPTYTGCADFQQNNDGLLDTYAKLIRFGLMTFDARPSAGTGLNGSTADYSTGIDGNWSYYVGSPVTGYPVNCAAQPEPSQEVGARNAAAPPWEGRMVAFGPANEADPSPRNQWIQDVLLSTRPYGATPIAGQLDDAKQFLYEDRTKDPLSPSDDFGPRSDPNWKASSCRRTILILLTDGEPNLDLRPYCTPEPAGKCPYKKPAEIVAALHDGSGAPQPNMTVETYVIGFALSSVRPAGATRDYSCGELTTQQCTDNPNDVNIQACCTLNEIAAAGGSNPDGSPRKAYFASNRTELKEMFADIFDDVVRVATRTMPVFSSPGGDTSSKGFKFFSAFEPQPDPTATQLWKGVLQRKRFVCTNLDPELKYDPRKGDDFAANLNSNVGNERRFYTVAADGNESHNSVRPYVTANDDGLGTAGGDQEVATGPSAVTGIITPEMMSIDADTCEGSQTDAQCRDLIVQHLVGLVNTDGKSRCTSAGCQLFGGIYHSVPVAVPGRPSELLRDESYEEFAAEMAELARPSVLYTSTVDGFLHAFNLAPFPGSDGAASRAIDSKKNNELWAFIPPAVLPFLDRQYPTTPITLLDGMPIVKDVVARESTDDPPKLLGYERIADDAQAGSGSWRSVLVQGFGDTSPVGGGYFALDITKPDRDDEHSQKPVFRWQLTRDNAGKPLFGAGGTPLITTVFLGDKDDPGGPREVAVAVLPGGDALPTSGTSTTETTLVMDTDTGQSAYKSTRNGRNYETAAAEPARSLTIVRLDTGEVIKTFRPVKGSFATGVWKETDLDAPITGQPRAFPETTGAVADRIYVGDRDGRLWRLDVSSQDADDWEMKRMYDAFHDGTSTSSQPVILPPVLSVDEIGNVTIAFATGSQDLDTSDNRVISLTETLNDDNEFVTHVNWIHQLDTHDRVTGNMVLFNSGLYYAVSRPPETTGAACDVGSSKIYGTHYTHSSDYETATAARRRPNPSTGPGKATTDQEELELANQPGLVFGVSLEAEPTCAAPEQDVLGNDSFGYGSVSMSTQVNPGKFYLSFSASGNDTGGSDHLGVLEVRQELQSPRLPVTFQSWAVVYE